MDYQGKSRMEIRPHLSPMNIRFARVSVTNFPPNFLSDEVPHEKEQELTDEVSSFDYPLEPPDDALSNDLLNVEEEEIYPEIDQETNRATLKAKPNNKISKRRKPSQEKN